MSIYVTPCIKPALYWPLIYFCLFFVPYIYLGCGNVITKQTIVSSLLMLIYLWLCGTLFRAIAIINREIYLFRIYLLFIILHMYVYWQNKLMSPSLNIGHLYMYSF